MISFCHTKCVRHLHIEVILFRQCPTLINVFSAVHLKSFNIQTGPKVMDIHISKSITPRITKLCHIINVDYPMKGRPNRSKATVTKAKKKWIPFSFDYLKRSSGSRSKVIIKLTILAGGRTSQIHNQVEEWCKL